MTRREYLKMCALVPAVWSSAVGPRPQGTVLQLAHSFADSALKVGNVGAAISPDGTRLCLERWKETGYPVDILELGTWRSLFRTRLESRVQMATFFSDGNRLMLEHVSKSGRLLETIVSVSDGNKTNRLQSVVIGASGNDETDLLTPLRGNVLLSQLVQFRPRYERHTLRLVELPDYRELLRTPFATQPRAAMPMEFDMGLSPARDLMVYAFDDVIVCRRTDNFRVLWTLSTGSLSAFKLSVASAGTYVVAACADSPFRNRQQISYVALIDQSGREITHIPVNGTDGLAISPGGDFLAVCSPERQTRANEVHVMVKLYELPSGRMVDSVRHDIVKGSNTFLTEQCNLVFSSDGKYLVSSGTSTNIWEFKKGT